MLGRQPIVLARRDADHRRQGPPVLRDVRGRQPLAGRHVLLAYLPPEHAVEGNHLFVEYFAEQYPVTVAVVGSRPLFDPDNRPDPGLTMKVLVCVKSVPAVARPDRPDRGRPGDRHPAPRLHDRPARGVRGRAGGADRRGRRRRGGRPDPRPGRGAWSRSATRWRSGIAARDPPRDRRRRVGPGVDRRRDRRRGARRRGGERSVRPDPASATRPAIPAATRSRSGSRRPSAARS